MAVEGKGLLQARLSHQRERNTIREAHALVGELLHQIDRCELNFGVGTEYLKPHGSINGPGLLGSKSVAASARQQRESLIQNEIARDAQPALLNDLLP
jgi:hypothetical protein